jgi:hemerythrin-like domain-containing protein
MGRRSDALAPLTRDHHHALVIAMALSRATGGTARSSGLLFADFISEHEARHFAVEESILLPALPAGERSATLAARIRDDHRHLRAMAQELGEGRGQATVELVRALGARLRAHVQLEERELFPCLEQALDPAALERIGSELRAALPGDDAVQSA